MILDLVIAIVAFLFGMYIEHRFGKKTEEELANIRAQTAALEADAKRMLERFQK